MQLYCFIAPKRLTSVILGFYQPCQFIIGLGGFLSAWQRQAKDFGHSPKTNGGHSQKYSVLVFDNRGMGKSDKPIAGYSTSDLAKDTLELAGHLGWTVRRQLHVVGSSMGGMIAQEMVRSEGLLAHNAVLLHLTLTT